MCLWDVMWSPSKQTPGALKWLPFGVPGLEQCTQGSPGTGISSVIKATPDPNDFPVCKLNIKTKSTGSNRKGQIYQRGLPVLEVLQICCRRKKPADWVPPALRMEQMVPQAPSFTRVKGPQDSRWSPRMGRRTSTVSYLMENLLDSVGFYIFGFFFVFFLFLASWVKTSSSLH